MSFKDRSFENRFKSLGDEAEAVFEACYPQGFVRYGLNRPPIGLGTVPAFVRYTPDYLTSKGLVEVQGFGRDQTAKFKLDKLDALLQWQGRFRVDIFLWDSSQKRYGWVRLAELWQAGLDNIDVKLTSFPEGKQYLAFPAAEIPVIEWIPHGEALSASR